MKKTIVINLYGGPGTGKSTTALNLAGLLKSNHIEAELVREYVKNFVWEKREILESDQVYILAKQHRSERILYGKVDVIVTDSPMWLVQIYEKQLTRPPYVASKIIEKFVNESKEIAEHHHIFLTRFHAYQETGRIHTEEEAHIIDGEIKDLLKQSKIKYHEVIADKGAELEIAKILNLL